MVDVYLPHDSQEFTGRVVTTIDTSAVGSDGPSNDI